MRDINSNGRIGKNEYAEWPLFKEFRKTKEFLLAYEEIFDEKFEEYEETIDNEIKVDYSDAAATAEECMS